MEQQSAPWRVFDAPVAPDGSGTASAAPGAAGGAASLVPVVNQRLAIAGVLGALAVGGLAVVVAMSGMGGGIAAGPDASIAGAAPSGDPAVAGAIVVDVSGAVVTPGVYRLATGARIGDAIEAAGGFSPRVDAERVAQELNLAATVVDGAQVHVPSRDEETPATGGGAGGGSGGAGSGGGSGGGLVNLNTATEAELDALPGIGPVTAGKIIESRGEAPFKTIDELRARGLVGEKTFEKLKPLISVG